MNKIYAYLKKDVNLLIISGMIGLIITFFTTYIASAYSNNVQADLSDHVIRFHIIANSDSEYDQKIKVELKDAIFAEFASEIEDSGDINESREVINSLLDEIKTFSDAYLNKRGIAHTTEIRLENSEFPTKSYGDLSLPAGNYEALKVIIGEGNGQNFWCVMFPPLCFVDVTKTKISTEMRDKLKTVVSEESFLVVSGSSEQKPAEYKIKFKIVEIFNELFSN